MGGDDPLGDYDPRPTHDLDDIKDTIDQAVSELREVVAAVKKSDRGSPLDIVWVLFVVLLLGEWSGSKLDRLTDRGWYSIGHQTDWANVNVQRRPTDCDFLHAPIGTKRCSYKKGSYIFGEEERRAAIGRGTTEEERLQASKQPNSVVVYWDKKDEP